jgi:hypothetical protein
MNPDTVPIPTIEGMHITLGIYQDKFIYCLF